VGVSNGVITLFNSFDFNRCWSSHYHFFLYSNIGRYFLFFFFSFFLSKSVYIKRRISTYRYSLQFFFSFFFLYYFSFHLSHSVNKSIEKRFDWLPEGLMVEVYTEPLSSIFQSTTGSFKYRTYKRQRIKFNISYSSIDPNN